MKEKKYFNALFLEIERALEPIRFIPYDEAWGFIENLQGVKQK